MTLTLCLLLQAVALFPPAVPDEVGDEGEALSPAAAPSPWWDGLLRPSLALEGEPWQQRAQSSGPSGSQFLDFKRMEFEPRLSLLIFGGDAEADPELGGGVLVRAPMPWLSPRSKEKGEYFGLFVEFTISRMDRDLDPPPSDTSGTIFFAGAGVDYTFVRGRNGLVMAQLGFEYGNFGGISDTDDGVALLLGGVGGLRLWGQLWATYNPQFHLAFTGDWIMFNSLGILLRF